MSCSVFDTRGRRGGSAEDGCEMSVTECSTTFCCFRLTREGVFGWKETHSFLLIFCCLWLVLCVLPSFSSFRTLYVSSQKEKNAETVQSSISRGFEKHLSSVSFPLVRLNSFLCDGRYVFAQTVSI